MRVEFIAEEAKGKWDEVEINPVKETTSGDAEIVEEGQEDFWSVYLHQTEGGVACVADLPTKDLAIALKELLENSARSFSEPIKKRTVVLTPGKSEQIICGKNEIVTVELPQGHNIVDVSNADADNWQEKYEKCIKTIKKFDAGIIGMYDL